MTIIVYDAKADVCMADRMYTASGGMRPLTYDRTKVNRTAAGHVFASAGSGSERLCAIEIDLAIAAYQKGEFYTFQQERAEDGSLLVRSAGRGVFLSVTVKDGAMALYPRHRALARRSRSPVRHVSHGRIRL